MFQFCFYLNLSYLCVRAQSCKLLWKWMFFPVLFSSTKRFTFLLVILNVIEFDLDIWAVSSRRCRSNKILFSLNENLAAHYGMFKEIWLFRGVCCWYRATNAWNHVGPDVGCVCPSAISSAGQQHGIKRVFWVFECPVARYQSHCKS